MARLAVLVVLALLAASAQAHRGKTGLVSRWWAWQAVPAWLAVLTPAGASSSSSCRCALRRPAGVRAPLRRTQRCLPDVPDIREDSGGPALRPGRHRLPGARGSPAGSACSTALKPAHACPRPYARWLLSLLMPPAPRAGRLCGDARLPGHGRRPQGGAGLGSSGVRGAHASGRAGGWVRPAPRSCTLRAQPYDPHWQPILPLACWYCCRSAVREPGRGPAAHADPVVPRHGHTGVAVRGRGRVRRCRPAGRAPQQGEKWVPPTSSRGGVGWAGMRRWPGLCGTRRPPVFARRRNTPLLPRPTRMHMQPAARAMPSTGAECAMCKFVVRRIKTALNDSDAMEKVKEEALKVCPGERWWLRRTSMADGSRWCIQWTDPRCCPRFHAKNKPERAGCPGLKALHHSYDVARVHRPRLLA